MASQKLPILMYHNITPEKGNGLTIGVTDFENQCAFLASEGYKTHHFSEVLKEHNLAGSKNCIITFDDAYVHQLMYALPILERYQLKATFFVPLAYLGKTDSWNTGKLEIMTATQLRELPSENIELAFHSYQHQKYDALTPRAVSEDTQQCFQLISEEKLPFTPVLAYPYGKFPRKNPEKKKFFQQLEQNGLQLGLRIGNRVAQFPFKKPYEINRIDVKGEWTLGRFKRSIRFGKLL